MANFLSLLSTNNSFPVLNNKNKSIIFLENRDHVCDCLDWVEKIEGEKLIIALSPQVMYELNSKGITYKIPEDFYSADELYDIGYNNFVKVQKITNFIDNLIQKHSSEIRELNIKPSLFTYYSLKISYDAIVIRLFQLLRILKVENPSNIYIYNGDIYPFGALNSAPYTRFDKRESIYSQILSLNIYDLPITKLSYPKTNNCTNSFELELNKSNFRNIVKNLLIKYPLIYTLVFAIQKRNAFGFIKSLKLNCFTKKKMPVLLYGAAYNWDDSYDSFIHYSINPTFRILDNYNWLVKSEQLNIDSLDKVWVELSNDLEFKSYFKFEDIDFSSILETRIEYLVKQVSKECFLVVLESMSFIKNKKIKALISSTFATSSAHSVAQAAHNCRIPVITWQHGGYGMTTSHPLIAYCDFINSDYHFVFGTGVIYGHPEIKDYNVKLIPIGSASLETINSTRNGSKNSNNKILYATSSYMGNDLSISTYPPISDNLFWITQKSIIDILGKYSQKQVTVKLHPSTSNTPHILEEYVVEKRYNNIKFIRSEHSFPQLIKMNDIVIIDLPFTTILQALMFPIPIFAYTGHVHFNSHAHKLLSKRAVCIQNLKNYLYELDNYLITGVYRADLNNDEFLLNYGLSYSHGYAAHRAVKELKTIIHKFDISNDNS